MIQLMFDLSKKNESYTLPDGSTTSQDTVAEFVSSATSSAVSFMTNVIGAYWGTILSVAFVLFMIGLFWRMAKLKRR